MAAAAQHVARAIECAAIEPGLRSVLVFDATPEHMRAIENALRMLLAIGGSTNAIVHIAAVAGRLGIGIDLQAFDRLGRETPVLVDLKPTGQHYMEDLFKAGGVTAILRELKPLLNLDCVTVSGRTLGENIDAAPAPFAQDVVRPFANPIFRDGGIAVLSGNIFHRSVILGTPDKARAGVKLDGLAGLIFRQGTPDARQDDLQQNIGNIVDIVAHVAGTLAANGEKLRAGDLIITGSLVPPPLIALDETEFAYQLAPMERLSVRFGR